jgi:hypothetical protein
MQLNLAAPLAATFLNDDLAENMIPSGFVAGSQVGPFAPAMEPPFAIVAVQSRNDLSHSSASKCMRAV